MSLALLSPVLPPIPLSAILLQVKHNTDSQVVVAMALKGTQRHSGHSHLQGCCCCCCACPPPDFGLSRRSLLTLLGIARLTNVHDASHAMSTFKLLLLLVPQGLLGTGLLLAVPFASGCWPHSCFLPGTCRLPALAVTRKQQVLHSNAGHILQLLHCSGCRAATTLVTVVVAVAASPSASHAVNDQRPLTW